MNITKTRLILGISLVVILLLAVVATISYILNKQEGVEEKAEEPKEKVALVEEPGNLKPKTISEDKNEDINIQFYPKTGEYLVFIEADKLEDYQAKKKKAESMLKEIGIADLCSKKVRWPSPPLIKDQITIQDMVATGCPAP